MVHHNIQMIDSALVSVGAKREREKRRGWEPGFWLLALAVSSVVTVLLTESYPVAASYHFLPTPVSDATIDANPMIQSSAAHSSVLAAAFGFQSAGSSIITVRTYDGPTGAILSEDSFDVNIKEEGATGYDAKRGRIFAGGIEADAEGKSRFMLRVYDAESGRFLWEGQLNLLKEGEGGTTQAQFTTHSKHPTMIQTASGPAPFRILFSLRAVNPATGALIWQDQFSPGSRRGKGGGVFFEVPSNLPIHPPVERVFGLMVRAYDRRTGTLLWEDSFEQLDRLEAPAVDPYSDAYPQAIPSWSPAVTGNGGNHRTTLR